LFFYFSFLFNSSIELSPSRMASNARISILRADYLPGASTRLC
jgi:hypothetical protein